MDPVTLILALAFFATLVALVALGNGDNGDIAKNAIDVLGKAIEALVKLTHK